MSEDQPEALWQGDCVLRDIAVISCQAAGC
jgi:hypothetical protein